MIGDSIGFDFVFAIDPFKADLALDIHAMADPNCAPGDWPQEVQYPDGSIVAMPKQCAQQREFLRNELATWRPDTVLFLFGGGATQRRPIDGGWKTACDPVFRTKWTAGLTEMVNASTGGGADPVTVLAAYPRGDRIPSGTDQLTDCQNDATRAASDGAHVVDIGEWVCPDRRECRIFAEAAVWMLTEARRATGYSYDP